jgi:serine phosphatase RsbU (regulator of sigma subunit)
VETPGTWLGVIPDIADATTNSTLRLARGDIVVLYTDGLTEARDATKEQFGIDRLCELIEREHARPIEQLRQLLSDAALSWGVVQDDDVSVMVIQYLG